MAEPELSTNYNIKPGQPSNRAIGTKNGLERGQNKNNNKIINNNKNNPQKRGKQ